MIAAAVLLVAAAGTAWVLTGAVRSFALRHGILDQPTSRGLHVVPTPRGGGLAIAAVALPAIAVLGLVGLLPARVVAALVGGGVAVAWIGWRDDRTGVTPGARAGVHLVAALWALYWLGGLPDLELGVYRVSLGHLGIPLGAIGVVWLINLYNFMDGIDGLAGAEAVTVGLGGGLILMQGGATGLGLAALSIAAASMGFLAWNWAPAKIFMGDVGSGLLGFLFAGLALASENSGSTPALVWILLLGVFGFDTTATLLRRVWRREAWYAPHRSHAYQRLVRLGWPHARVTSAVIGVNLVLVALALIARADPRLFLPALLIGLGMLAGRYLAAERAVPLASGSDPAR